MKKKITRRNFEELKKMNRLLDVEAAKIRGGDVYYGFDGKYLGCIGPGDTLHFVDQSTYDRFKAFGTVGFGTTFNNLNRDSQIYFLSNFWDRSYIYMTDIDTLGNIAGVYLESGFLYFTNNCRLWGSYYNILSVLDHERYHYDNHAQHTGYIYDETNDNEVELQALIHQFSQPNFAYTTSDFQEIFMQELRSAMANAGWSQQDINNWFNNRN